MLSQLRPAIVLFALFTLLTGLAYPLAITGIGQKLFPHQANGSLIEKDGKVIGSALIGQTFTADKYFHGRPSATTDTDPNDSTKTVPSPYNAANSGGSNLGPTSKALIDRVKADTDKLKAENPNAPVPVDLVTTSASGLDPDISLAAALFQVPRIARTRGLSADKLNVLISDHTQQRWLGIIGEPVVNVLDLNLVLDATPGQGPVPAAESSAAVVPAPVAEPTPAPESAPAAKAAPTVDRAPGKHHHHRKIPAAAKEPAAADGDAPVVDTTAPQ